MVEASNRQTALATYRLRYQTATIDAFSVWTEMARNIRPSTLKALVDDITRAVEMDPESRPLRALKEWMLSVQESAQKTRTVAELDNRLATRAMERQRPTALAASLVQQLSESSAAGAA
ncbi:MAG TPA: hypothetical protein VEY95_17230 [Azospirillaceae bacterium]|nr:hypothetical protein [Azospirillaceae bacterium]